MGRSNAAIRRRQLRVWGQRIPATPAGNSRVSDPNSREVYSSRSAKPPQTAPPIQRRSRFVQEDRSGDLRTLALLEHHPLRAELRQFIRINLNAQAGELRDHEQALIIKSKWFGGDLVDVQTGREVLDVAGDRNRGGKLEIGGQPDGRVPAVGDDLDIVVVRQPGDPPRLAQAAVLGAVGLNDIDGPALDPGLKRLPTRQHLAPGDRYG